MGRERIIDVRPRTVLKVAGLLVGVAVVVWVAWISRRVLTWTLVALFLAMALNPAVAWLQGNGVHRRGAAVAIVYVSGLLVIAGLGALIVPTIVQQVDDLIQSAPRYVEDLTAGRGPLGFLETKYHVVERVQKAVDGGGGGGAALAGSASTALDIGRSVLTFLAGVITIAFLTLFMLLQGPATIDRMLALLPAPEQPRWRHIAHEIARTVGGYVNGNLLISLIAGTVTTIVLLALGVPYALALGLLVAILDLIPLAGATLAAILVSLIAVTHTVTAGIVVLAFFAVYQQIENHLLQPIIYGRTVQLSPLWILLSVLIGAEVAGVVGALSAIPVAGTIQILIDDLLQRRADARREELQPHYGLPTAADLPTPAAESGTSVK
jgi:predicted PurR-regulated permease PerM